MSKILNEICIRLKEDLEITKNRCSLSSLKKLLPNKKNRNLKNLLNISHNNNNNNIIAEIKKSSPSAGNIIDYYHPDNIAIQYEKSGAGAISILTESNFFDGHIDHLSLINSKTNIPILRKDFIIDEYQIYESKVFKADAILLIATILNDNTIKKFIEIADDIGLDYIIESHSSEELKRVIKLNYEIIGINNRNLDTLSIDINNTLNLIKDISKDFTVVGESGIKTNNDIKLYNKSGVYNFLIGETILKSKDREAKIRELLGKC